jgi:quercetin dioxygenase-like cupin family protein
MVIPPGGGAPAVHIHSREDETFVVTRGTFRFWHGNKVVDAGPASVVYFPRNEPHQFRNIGKTSGEVAVTIVPAGLERFFLELGRRHLTMPKDLREINRLSALYGIRVVGPPKKP